jgi:cytochrome c oxidase assembly protein subunit 16
MVQNGGAPPKKAKFSMAPKSQDELENVRVPRPASMPSWGPAVITDGDAPKKGARKEDRWV